MIHLLIFLTKFGGHRPRPRGVPEALVDMMDDGVISDPNALPSGVLLFEQTEDEVRERESGECIKTELAQYEDKIMQYFHSPLKAGEVASERIQAYLLPSQGGPGVTTRAVIRVRRGRVFHCKVEYLTRAEAQQYAFSFIQQTRAMEDVDVDDEMVDAGEESSTGSGSGSGGKPSAQELEVAEARFKHLTGIPGSRLDLGGETEREIEVDEHGHVIVTEQERIPPPGSASDVHSVDR